MEYMENPFPFSVLIKKYTHTHTHIYMHMFLILPNAQKDNSETKTKKISKQYLSAVVAAALNRTDPFDWFIQEAVGNLPSSYMLPPLKRSTSGVHNNTTSFSG